MYVGHTSKCSQHGFVELMETLTGNMEGKAAKSTILSTAAGGNAGLDSAVSTYSEKLLSKLLLKAHYPGKKYFENTY